MTRIPQMRRRGAEPERRGDRSQRGDVVPLPPPSGAGRPWPENGPRADGAQPQALASVAAASAAAGSREQQRGLADRELLAKRDRLIERFAAMQLDLGGVYYEMAIRDHIRPDVLTRKAAEMQRVDAELRQVEEVLDNGGSTANKCPACDALYAPGAAFCSQCGSPLAPPTAGRSR